MGVSLLVIMLLNIFILKSGKIKKPLSLLNLMIYMMILKMIKALFLKYKNNLILKDGILENNLWKFTFILLDINLVRKYFKLIVLIGAIKVFNFDILLY